MMKSLVFLCALMGLASAEEETKVTLCGRQLAQARELVCYGSSSLFKRSINDIPNRLGSLTLGNWVWGGRRDALAARWARHKRGLVDECCHKTCSVEVIRMYC